jgi:hypothetical protein
MYGKTIYMERPSIGFPPGSVLAGDLSYRATAGVLGNTCFFSVPKLTKFQ